MRVWLSIALGCLLAGGAAAQRGGGGHMGGGGFHGGGGIGGGFRGGGGIGGGFRGGFGGFNGFRGGVGFNGFRGGFGFRGFYGGYWPYYYPYLGYGWDWGGGWPYYDYGSPYYDYGYGSAAYYPSYGASPNVTVVYPSNAQPAPVYVERATPVTREYDEYGQEIHRPGNPSSSPIYLVAFKDHSIAAAAAYWVDGRTLHYVTLQHEEKTAPLDSVDRDFSLQLNRERRVQFQLPQ